ncbi:MAG: DUF615 domain-containing protein [Methylomonas sp.]|nr:DUF615 domain-containing protein [Methylomonas sp.]PPD22828.1 MAG: hypothetical protein CTY23_00425 [Methylomonas sp.]PPD25424.1 MAG: hypothetical protein CTY22_08715 [Methylomonas sp.]PPD36071.1 MAG: hypothetical protein CTY21_08720 [Methylomonas sp.]PPD42735.1 MAG: hypothetical protein CTY17_00040 [Methylomonas sp.]
MIEDVYEGDDGDEDVEYYAIRPNKTQIKKQIAAVFAMAEELCELAPAHIAEFQLPDAIEAALLDAGKMGKNAARKRLLKYITAQLRLLDIDAIQEQLARMKSQSAHAVREHHQAERWRDLLLSDTDNRHLTDFIDEHPDADAQHLRQLVRGAQKEAMQAKPPKSARQLYRYLKNLTSHHDESPFHDADSEDMANAEDDD